MTWRRRSFVLIGILTIGLLLRLTSWAGSEPRKRSLDEEEYHTLAVNFLGGKGYTYEGLMATEERSLEDFIPPIIPSGPTASRAPLYPLFLAFLYACFGTGSFVPILFQVVLSLGIVYGTFLVGRFLFDEDVGILASGFVALSWKQTRVATFLLTETLHTFLWLAALFTALKYGKENRKRFLVLLSVSTAFAMLTRSEALLLVPVVLFWILQCKRSRLRTRLKHITIYLLLVFSMISPWIYRNLRVMGAPIFSSTTGGYNFFWGSPSVENALSGQDLRLHQYWQGILLLQDDQAQSLSKASLGEKSVERFRQLGEVKAEKILYREKLKLIQQRPLEEGVLVLKKMLAVFYPVHPGTGQYLILFGFILPFFLHAFFLRRDYTLGLLRGFIFPICLVAGFYNVTWRSHIVIEPLIALLGAVSLLSVSRKLWRHPRGRVLFSLFLLGNGVVHGGIWVAFDQIKSTIVHFPF